MLSRIVLLLLLVGGASSICDCLYKNQPPSGYNIDSWSTFYIQNPFDDNGNPCSTTCTYLLNSTDSSKGISNFAIIQWDGPTSGENTLSFFNTDANGKKNGDPFATSNGNAVPSFITKTQYLLLELTMTVPEHILATLIPTSGLATTPAPVVETTTAPPAPYTGVYVKDPAKISNDLMIMVDAGAGKSEAIFNETKILAASIVEALTNVIAANASFAPVTGTRLAVNSLTKINTGNLVAPWVDIQDKAVNALKTASSVLSFPANYTQAVTQVLGTPGPFIIKNTGTDAYQNSRKQAQRMLLIVTANIPDDINNLTSQAVTESFTAVDVHPVLITYKFQFNDTILSLLKAANWDVFYAANNDNETVLDFVDNHLLNSDLLCNSMTSQATAYSVNNTVNSLHVPANYQGDSKKANNKWSAVSSQTARYCNFQQLTYNFNIVDGKSSICFTVYYELETDKDFLRFQDSQGNHIASFTGSDVSGSTFTASGNVTAVFSTNESQVFAGFDVEYNLCP